MSIKETIYASLAFFIIMTVAFLAANYYFQDCQTLKEKFSYMQAPARCIR